MKAIQVDKRKIRIKIKVKLKQKTMESWLGDEDQDYTDDASGRGEAQLVAPVLLLDPTKPQPKSFEKWLEEIGGIKGLVALLEELKKPSKKIPDVPIHGKAQASMSTGEGGELKIRLAWFQSVDDAMKAVFRCCKASTSAELIALELKYRSFFTKFKARRAEASRRVIAAAEARNAGLSEVEKKARQMALFEAQDAESQSTVNAKVAAGTTNFVVHTAEDIAAADELLSDAITLLKEIQAERATPSAEVDKFTHETSDALREAARL